MNATDVLTIIGWPVTCLLSLACGVLLTRLSAKKKILSWGVISESELISQHLANAAGIPVKIEVGGHSPKSVSLVRLRIGNAGNDLLEKIVGAVKVNPAGRILDVKPVQDLGEYADHVKWTPTNARLNLEFDFINPKDVIDLEILLCDYDPGTFIFDASSPGVQLRRREPNNWNFTRQMSLFRNFGFSLLGFRYDPSILPMSDIATELRALRREMQDR